jgi:hypothetical protein
MKNKLFSVAVVIVILLMALSWIRGQLNQNQVNEINREINDLKYNLYLMNLKASSLIEEMEMLRFKSSIQSKDKRLLLKRKIRSELMRR